MIKEAIIEKYGYDTPVFTKEILEMFPEYSEVYVFRKLKEEKENGEISSLDRGIYYISEKYEFGNTTITPLQAMKKRYMEDGDDVYGVYGGFTLQNMFGLIEQMPNTVEIISNNESTRKREVMVGNMTFILRKSRVTITRENAPTYMVLELFSEENSLALNPSAEAMQIIKKYMEKNNITRTQLIEMSHYFPKRGVINMVNNGII